MQDFLIYETILHMILKFELELELGYLQSFNRNRIDEVLKSYKGEKTERQILEESFFANFEFDKFAKELTFRIIEVIVNYTNHISKDEKYSLDFFKIFSSFISSKIAKKIIIAIENVNSYSTNPTTDDIKYNFFEKDNFAKRVKLFNAELFSEHYKPYSKTKNIFDPQLQYKKSEPSIDNFIKEILLESEMLISLFLKDIKRAIKISLLIENKFKDEEQKRIEIENRNRTFRIELMKKIKEIDTSQMVTQEWAVILANRELNIYDESELIIGYKDRSKTKPIYSMLATYIKNSYKAQKKKL